MKIQLGHDIKFTVLVSLFLSFSLFKLYQSPPSFRLVGCIIIFVYFYTDIISGLLHLILDDEKSLEIPLICSLAKGFQSHHENPNHIYEMSLYKHLYVMHLPLTLVYPLVSIFNTPAHHTLYITVAFMLHAMQMSHRWAHLPKTTLYYPLPLLKKAHIILNSSEHGIHHKPPFSTNFCIMSGWFNPYLNYIFNHLKIGLNSWIALFIVISILPIFVASAANSYL